MHRPYADYYPRRLVILAGDPDLATRWLQAFRLASPGCPYTPYRFEDWADLDPDYAWDLHAQAARTGEMAILCGPAPCPGRTTLLDLPPYADHADLVVVLTPEATHVAKNRMGPTGLFDPLA